MSTLHLSDMSPTQSVAGVSVASSSTDGRVKRLRTLIREGDEAGVAMFLKQNREVVNMQASDGASALHSAVHEAHDGIILMLLRKKADVRMPDDNGNTPLHIAAEQGNVGVVKVLVQYKSDPSLRNALSLRPADVARKHQHLPLALSLDRLVMERRKGALGGSGVHPTQSLSSHLGKSVGNAEYSTAPPMSDVSSLPLSPQRDQNGTENSNLSRTDVTPLTAKTSSTMQNSFVHASSTDAPPSTMMFEVANKEQRHSVNTPRRDDVSEASTHHHDGHPVIPLEAKRAMFENEQLHLELESSKTLNTNIQQELDTLQAQLGKSSLRIVALEQEKRGLVAVAEKAEKKVEEAEAQQAEREARLTESYQEQVDELASQINFRLEEEARLKSEIAQRETSAEQRRSSSAARDADALEKEREKNRELQRKNVEAKFALANVSTQEKRHKDALQQYANDLKHANENAFSLSDQLSKCERELTENSFKVERLAREAEVAMQAVEEKRKADNRLLKEIQAEKARLITENEAHLIQILTLSSELSRQAAREEDLISQLQNDADTPPPLQPPGSDDVPPLLTKEGSPGSMMMHSVQHNNAPCSSCAELKAKLSEAILEAAEARQERTTFATSEAQQRTKAVLLENELQGLQEVHSRRKDKSVDLSPNASSKPGSGTSQRAEVATLKAAHESKTAADARRITSLEEMNQELSQRASEATSRIKASEEESAKHSANITALTAERDSVQEELKKLRLEDEVTRRQSEERSAALKVYEKENVDLKVRAQHLDERLQEQAVVLKKSEGDLLDLKVQIEREKGVKKENKSASPNHSTTEEKNRLLETQRVEHETVLAELQERASREETRSQEILAQNSALLIQTTEFQKRVEELTLGQAELEKEIEAAKAPRPTSANTLSKQAKLRDEVTALHTELTQCQSKVAELEEAETVYKQRLVVLGDQVVEMETAAVEAGIRERGLQATLNEKKVEEQQQQQQQEEQQQQLKEEEGGAEVAALQTALEAARTEVASCTMRLAEAEKKVKASLEELEAVKGELEESRSACSQQREENGRLQKESSTTGQELAQMKETMSHTSHETLELHRLSSENTALQEKEKKAREQENLMRTNLEQKLTEQHATHVAEVDSLAKLLKREGERCAAAERELTTLQAHIATTTKQPTPAVSKPSTPALKPSSSTQATSVDNKVTERLKHDLQELHEANATLQKLNDGMKRHEAHLEAERSIFHSDTKSLQGKLVELQKTLGVRDAMVKDLQHKLDNANNAFNIEHCQTAIERKLKEALEKETARLTNELNRLHAEHDDLLKRWKRHAINCTSSTSPPPAQASSTPPPLVAPPPAHSLARRPSLGRIGSAGTPPSLIPATPPAPSPTVAPVSVLSSKEVLLEGEAKARRRIIAESEGEVNLIVREGAEACQKIRVDQVQRDAILERQKQRAKQDRNTLRSAGRLLQEEEAVRHLVVSDERAKRMDVIDAFFAVYNKANIADTAEISKEALQTLEKLHRKQDTEYEKDDKQPKPDTPVTPAIPAATHAAISALPANLIEEFTRAGMDLRNITTKFVPDVDPATGKRVGLRELSVRTDPRLFYMEQCVLTSAKVNTSFLESLPKDADQVKSIGIAHNYIGKKGIRAVLDVLQLCKNVESLDLSDNKLENTPIMWLADIAKGHPNLKSISLDTNLIAKNGGAALLSLLQERPQVVHLSVANNPLLMVPMVRRLHNQVEVNKQAAASGVSPHTRARV